MLITGAITALITPFKEEEVDEEGFRENIQFQIDQGIDGVLALGSTGENATLTFEEQEKIIVSVIHQVKGRIPVIINTGDNGTLRTIIKTKIAKKHGADAALIVTPYYNKPTQEGIFRHFEAITSEVQLPIIVYNHPGRSGVNIELDTLLRISKLPNIIGVKESSSNIDQIGDVIQAFSENTNFSILSGDDTLTFPLIALGGHGVISVAANVFPAQIKQMVHSALNGEYGNARSCHYKLLSFFKACFIETNPVPIKTMMNLLGMAAGEPRLPLCELKKENFQKIQNEISKYSSWVDCSLKI